MIVRPVILTNGPKTASYRALVDPRGWTCGYISRADVADFLVKQIDGDAFLHKTPVLTQLLTSRSEPTPPRRRAAAGDAWTRRPRVHQLPQLGCAVAIITPTRRIRVFIPKGKYLGRNDLLVLLDVCKAAHVVGFIFRFLLCCRPSSRLGIFTAIKKSTNVRSCSGVLSSTRIDTALLECQW